MKLYPPILPNKLVVYHEPFNGLFWVFNDSLPDGCGQLLVDRLLLKHKINPIEIDNINCLAVVQNSGTGALIYSEQECQYSLLAKDCRTNMAKIRLFLSKIYSGYFGVKRFDHTNSQKVHMVSASWLLETSHRLPNLDYNILMKLTLELTRNYQNVEQLFRLMYLCTIKMTIQRIFLIFMMTIKTSGIYLLCMI